MPVLEVNITDWHGIVWMEYYADMDGNEMIGVLGHDSAL